MPLKFKHKSIVFSLVELNQLRSCGKSESEFESNGFEIQNPNPKDLDFSWLRHIPREAP